MINNLFQILKTIWQKILFNIWANIWIKILQIVDTLYRVCVRTLYHSKTVGVLSLIWIIVFITSTFFCLSVFIDAKNFQNIDKAENKYSKEYKEKKDNKNGGSQNYQGLHVIDVGQGDSLLYITQENQTVLIDTGKPGSGIVQKIENILGKYRKKIDVIILTHPDSDHVGEIENILNSFSVGLILYSPIYDVRPDSKKAINEIKNKSGVLTLPVFAGENLSFSETESLYFLSPSFEGMTTFINKKELGDDNYFSVVSMIKNKDLIFAMADAPQKIEKVLVSSASTSSLKFDTFDQLSNFTGDKFMRNQFDKIILKVGHHGSKTSSAPSFIQKLSPTDAVLSYGKNNRYGHPHKEVLDLFEGENYASSTLPTSPKIKIHQTISGEVYFSE